MGIIYRWAGFLDLISIISILLGNLFIPAVYLLIKGIIFLIFVSRKCFISMLDTLFAILLFFSGFSNVLVFPLLMYLSVKVFLAFF